MNIFLCYPSAERATADQIRLALVAQGHDVFFDRSDLPAGEEYHQRISRAIEQSDALVFLVTPDSFAEGRYTLTELDIAQAKWEHPAGHVLPVMVQPTPIKDLPPYLRAVTILEPKGDVAANVARAVGQLSSSGFWRKVSTNLKLVIGLGLGLALLSAVALVVSDTLALKREITEQLMIGQTQEQAQDYAAAWTTYEQANKNIQGRQWLQWLGNSLVDDITQARTNVVMQWLDNISVPSDKRFANIVDPLLPTLDEAIAHTEGLRKGKVLAYRGWADFLRLRDGLDVKPEVYYQRAIEADSSNAHAHAMWGHWVLWRGGDLADADRHFTQALTVAEHRPVVRKLQLAALGNRGSSDEFEFAQIRVANDMRRGQEPLDFPSRKRLYVIFEMRLRPRGVPLDLTELTAVLAPTELLTTYQWLFDEKEFPRSEQFLAPYVLSVLQAAAGQSEEAKQTLQAFRSTLEPSHTYQRAAVDDALARLNKLSSTP